MRISDWSSDVCSSDLIDGMVHLSDISWDRPGEEAIQDFKKGDMVQVKVLDVDVEKERISLGMKQLVDDPFEKSAGNIKRGDVVTCTVTAITDGGIEVSISDGQRSEEHTSELQSLMRISYAVFCLKKKKTT